MKQYILEPLFFVLCIVGMILAIHALKTFLCALSPSFKWFIEKLDRVPEDETNPKLDSVEKRMPLPAGTDKGDMETQRPHRNQCEVIAERWNKKFNTSKRTKLR